MKTSLHASLGRIFEVGNQDTIRVRSNLLKQPAKASWQDPGSEVCFFGYCHEARRTSKSSRSLAQRSVWLGGAPVAPRNQECRQQLQSLHQKLVIVSKEATTQSLRPSPSLFHRVG